MTTPLANQPAFPFICPDVSKVQVVEMGLNKREYVSALVLQGLCASPLTMKSAQENDPNDPVKFMAQAAVDFADALIAELEKQK